MFSNLVFYMASLDYCDDYINEIQVGYEFIHLKMLLKKGIQLTYFKRP